MFPSTYICLYVERRVDISIVVISYAINTIECGSRRMSELSNAALCMKQDTNSIENFKVGLPWTHESRPHQPLLLCVPC